MKRENIFQGPEEVAGQSYYFVKGLKENGCKVRHVVRKKNPFAFSCDKSLNIDRSKKYLFPLYLFRILVEEIKDLFICDIFHFHYGQTLMYNSDLAILKFFRKKIFMEFHGSDLRDTIRAHEINPYDIETEQGLTPRHQKLILSACKFADGIILHDDELIPYLPENHPPIFVVPLRIDPYDIAVSEQTYKNEKITIVHAPTNRQLKGSDYIEDAIHDLQQEIDINYVRVENMKRKEAFDIYQNADIIIDQIRIGTYGVFAIEGMAMAKPVITYLMPSMELALPEELPIVSANKDTIKQKLKELISNEEARKSIGEKGRIYAETYHDYRINSKLLLDIYQGKFHELTGRQAFFEVNKIYQKRGK